MTTFIIVWSLLTGSLFTFNCESPFNRGKPECVQVNMENDEYFQRVWGTSK